MMNQLKIKFIKYFSFLVRINILLWMLSMPSFAKQKQINDSKLVVETLIVAMQKNDAKQIRSTFAKNASQVYGAGTPNKGSDFWSWLENDVISAKAKVNRPVYFVEGDRVVVKGIIENSRGYRNKANFLFVVRDNKIISWVIRY